MPREINKESKMFQIYIWGAGFYAQQVLDEIDASKATVLGIIDSDEKKKGNQLFYPIPVILPSDVIDKRFDYIIISVKNYESIEKACKKIGIISEKIIVYWKEKTDDYIFIKRSEQIARLIQERQIYKYRLDSAPYEWKIKKSPKIYEGTELLRRIAKKRSSLCRFGDGEFEMIRGNERPWFQNPDETLGKRLKEILVSNDNSIDIAIAQNFYGLDKYKESAADDIRAYMYGDTRDDILELIDENRAYYDAYVTRPYIMYKDKKNADEIFLLFKKIWKDRKVLVVEGEYSRIGVGNDLLDCASSVVRILCPFKNAWSKYDSILKVILEKVSKETLVCISLGPAATILAYDLARRGYQALDIGQLDNEYEWYLRRAKERVKIQGKMVAEFLGEQKLELSNREGYQSQIIAEII